MIRKSVLQSLTEDELAMLLYVTNVLKPPGFGLQVNENILAYYKKDYLVMLCRFFKKDVLPEHHGIYDNLIAKLEGTYKEVTHDTPNSTAPDQPHDIPVP